MSHVEAVHSDGAYKCDKCDFATVKKEELKSHVETDQFKVNSSLKH